MANSQSALAASIANEGTFKIDKYNLASCDIAFYKGHYYSGQAPGISFLSAPVYLLFKPIFYLVPDKTIDSLASKIEDYGVGIEKDYWGNDKVLSNYFPELTKRQMLEYVIIAGFILPVFTTSLFFAFCVFLFYFLVKRFTKNEKYRMFATVLFAFGTAMFPLSTEYFERPIAITIMFASFIILFRIRKKEIKSNPKTIFYTGLLAGIASWFDYFHLLFSGMIFLYFLSFYFSKKGPTNGEIRILFFNLSKKDIKSVLIFIAGVVIPAILLFSYFYVIFDDPFANSYTHRTVSKSDASISGILQVKLPNASTLFHMAAYFLFSPVILISLYSLFKALRKKSPYRYEAVAILSFVLFISFYAVVLTLAYPDAIAPSFKRHMTVLFPYTMIFIPYLIESSKKENRKKVINLIIAIGLLSFFFNWTAAQYGGHHSLTQFDIENGKFITGIDFIRNGPNSDFLATLSGIFDLNSLLVNTLGLIVLLSVLFLLYFYYKKK